MATRGAANGAQAGTMNKKILASVREATGASEEDVQAMLAECNGDVNEAVTRLLDNPFEQVQNKRDRQKQTKRPEGAPPRGTSRGGDIPGSAGYGTVREVRRGGGFSGERGGRGGGRGGSRDRPPADRRPASSGQRSGGAPPGVRPPASTTFVQTVTVPRPAPASAAPPGPQVGNPPPIRPSAQGATAKSFTDILRKDPNPAPAPIPVPAPASPVGTPSAPSPVPAEPEPQAPVASAPHSTGLTFAEKLAAANIAASQAPVQPPPMAEPAPIQSTIQPPASYQPPQVSSEPPPAEVSSSTWGPPTAQSPTSLQNSGLAGLLSGKSTEEDKSPLDVSSATDSLGLQFGQFGMGGTGMGDFGAGFGAGFGDELGATHETVPAPAKSQQDAPDASTDAPVAYQPPPAYAYGQPPSAMSSLAQPAKASDAATAPPAASQFPSPYYGQPGYPHVAPQPPPPAPQGTQYAHYITTEHKPQQQPGQGLEYQYGQQQGRSDEYPATSAPAPSKYGTQGGHRSDGFGSHEPPSSSAAVSGGQAAPLQPVPPQQQQQMPAFPNPAMPPGMAHQYGYLHHQYPYMHNPNMYMYPNAYPHYGGAAAYPPQAGNTSFPPSVGSSTYQTQMPAGGPKYSYPYAQTSQTPLSSGLAPGGYNYSSPSGVYSGDDPSSVAGYSKDSKDSIYGSAGSQQQGGPQMARDSPYAYSMPGQGYQQQGYSAGAQGQYSTSAYAQYMQQAQQYAMPPNMGGQGGSQSGGQGQSGGYKLQ